MKNNKQSDQIKGNWHLVHVLNNTITDDESTQINVIATLSEEEKHSLNQANQNVNDTIRRLDIIDAVHLNVVELIETIVSPVASNTTIEILNPSFKDLPRELARRLLNLCASFNSMIKHQDTLLVREYGRSSIEVTKWKNFKKMLLCNRFEYALIYGLRNYIEHVDMPPVYCNAHQESDGTGEVRIELLRDAFLVDEVRLGDEITEHFKAQPEKIPLWPLLHNWHEIFREIAAKILDTRLHSAKINALSICNIRKHYKIENEGEIGLCFIQENDIKPEGFHFEISWLSDDSAERLCRLMEWS